MTTTTVCSRCGAHVTFTPDTSVLEIDERQLHMVEAILGSELSSLQCLNCGEPTGCTPFVVVWTDRRTRADLFEGGPWAGGEATAPDLPQLASVEVTRHGDLQALRASLDARYCQRSALFVEALRQEGSSGAEWFQQHYQSLGPETYVAALLATGDALSERIQLSDRSVSGDETQEMLGVVQSRACSIMCSQWAAGHAGMRLQDCIDALVFPDAVSSKTPTMFGTLVETVTASDISEALRLALETTHAWICACAGLDNPRVDRYTELMFELEVVATEAGGTLPVTAHLCRLDPDRLKSTLDPVHLEAVVLNARGPSIFGLAETAHRLGLPEVARRLRPAPVPDWLKSLGGEGAKGTMIMTGPDDKVIDLADLTPDGVLRFQRHKPEHQESPPDGAADEVFVSYCSRDRVKADIIAGYLRGLGLTVFMDHHTVAGDLWTRTIPHQLAAAQLVVVLWSRHSLQSGWVLKEAELAKQRGALLQVLLAPVAIPTPFAHMQSVHLEAWSNDVDHPGLVNLAKATFERLERDLSELQPAVVENTKRKLSSIEAAEAVFELCDATAWHSLAPASEATLNTVGPAYARLKAALAPAADETVHELMERFDLSRVFLLATIATLEVSDPRKRLPLPPPFQVRQQTRVMTVDCEKALVRRAMFVDALRELTGTTGMPSGSADPSDVLVLPNGITVEVRLHRSNRLLVGEVTARWP